MTEAVNTVNWGDVLLDYRPVFTTNTTLVTQAVTVPRSVLFYIYFLKYLFPFPAVLFCIILFSSEVISVFR